MLLKLYISVVYMLLVDVICMLFVVLWCRLCRLMNSDCLKYFCVRF